MSEVRHWPVFVGGPLDGQHAPRIGDRDVALADSGLELPKYSAVKLVVVPGELAVRFWVWHGDDMEAHRAFARAALEVVQQHRAEQREQRAGAGAKGRLARWRERLARGG